MRRSLRLLSLLLVVTAPLEVACIGPEAIQTSQRIYPFSEPPPPTAQSTLAIRELRREAPEEEGRKGQLIDDVPVWLVETARGTGAFADVVVGEVDAGDYVIDVSIKQRRRYAGITFTTAFVLPGLFGFFPILGLPFIYGGTDVSAEVRLFHGATPISEHAAVMPTSGWANWYMYWGRVGYATQHYEPELRAMIEQMIRDAAKVANVGKGGGG